MSLPTIDGHNIPSSEESCKCFFFMQSKNEWGKRRSSQGASLINWIAELRVGGDTPPRNDWNRLADKRDFARDSLTRWSFERVTLLGDAAHPMYPIGTNRYSVQTTGRI
ncbi:hypothetical protein P9578_07520 [Brevibacillus choshinensis]|uniref:hypothetical protein n=1 Tax=Brevibacillus choshinensis TaxID=54911 RepID=UPI002E24E946|nr:hypothetical protein [Brevibacillus choshinensis]